MTFRALLLLLACSCDGVSKNPAVPPDAPLPDAAEEDIDAPVQLVTHRYVLDRQLVPQTTSQARELGLDLNNDSVVDNQLGAVTATFVGQGFDVQAIADTSVDRGDMLVLVELASNGFTDGDATFAIHAGLNPQPPPCVNGSDLVCRRHLAGGASFDVVPNSSRPPLEGEFAAGTLVTAAGTSRLRIDLSLAVAPITFELVGARVKINSATEGAITSGVIAGAITESDIDTMLIPFWATNYNAVMVADCPGAPPGCGCAPGSSGDTLHSLFDTTPRDCAITANELRNNSLIQSLLAPDVTIDGQSALSVGIGFSAVAATFTP
jgi:hypothetical protein